MVVTDYKAQGGLGHVPASLSLYHVIDRSPCFVPQIMAWFALVVGARAALRPRIIHSLHSKKVERRAVLSWSLLHLCEDLLFSYYSQRHGKQSLSSSLE
jgi:hypothetical protein